MWPHGVVCVLNVTAFVLCIMAGAKKVELWVSVLLLTIAAIIPCV